jgi:Aminoglycoside-2''-adenylyltransferase
VSEWNWRPLDLDQAVRLLHGFPVRWWIAGGWALDLNIGRRTREHEDVDVLVLRSDQLAIQAHLAEWEIQVADGGRLEPWPAGQAITPPKSGFWARSEPGGPWEIQFLLAEHAEETWIYRRDPSITLPLSEIESRSEGGIPYLRPEIVLLYKSHHRRDRDEADLEGALPVLDTAVRARLRGWLPAGHPWLGRL